MKSEKIIKLNMLTAVVLFSVIAHVYAQPGWNFPENEEDSILASEKYALYTDYMKSDYYKEASVPLQWLFTYVPKLNESIYINGAKIFENLAENTTDPEQKKTYEDSTLIIYDLRIQNFNNEVAVLNRKVYTAYGFYKDDPSKFPELYEMYGKTFELSQNDAWEQNLLAYMDVVRRYKSSGGEISDEEILEIYEKITDIIDHKKSEKENDEHLEKTRDNVYRLLANMISLDCDFIQNNMGPELLENPDNLGLARNVFRFSLAGKCLDIPIFLTASRIIYDNEPNFVMAKLIGDRSYVNKDYVTAFEYYEEALKLTDENTKISDLYQNQANINSIQGNQPKARQLAYKAIEADPGNKDAYNTLGNLYYNSYQECKKGINEVEDRAVFFAAYEMYKRAGNSEGMKQAKEQFPLMETIHTYNMSPGDRIQIGCWINESVSVQRKD